LEGLGSGISGPCGTCLKAEGKLGKVIPFFFYVLKTFSLHVKNSSSQHLLLADAIPFVYQTAGPSSFLFSTFLNPQHKHSTVYEKNKIYPHQLAYFQSK
jgi:hypothetical protein